MAKRKATPKIKQTFFVKYRFRYYSEKGPAHCVQCVNYETAQYREIGKQWRCMHPEFDLVFMDRVPKARYICNEWQRKPKAPKDKSND